MRVQSRFQGDDDLGLVFQKGYIAALPFVYERYVLYSNCRSLR